MSYLDLFDNTAAKKTVIPPTVFVATDMTVLKISDSRVSQDIVVENAKHYRRLTPEYWAWFHHKYHLMEQALVNGKISEATFVEILNRISALYNLALAAFGKDALHNAEQTTDMQRLDKIIRNGSGDSHHAQQQPRNHPPSFVVERGNNKE